MSQALATAEWANPEAFAQFHAHAPGKFWLGRSPLNGQPLGYADDRHVCLVSGSRSGKGTTTIIPNLCLWPGSVVVVDPKGENATVTAARRGPGSSECEGMGQAVHVLDPFKVAQVDDGLRSRFNPLDILDPNDPRTIDDAGRIADAIVVINPETKDPFWDQSARALVKGLILYVLTDPMFEGRRNLVTIRQLITRGDYEGVALLREMGEKTPAPAQALLWQGVANNPAFNGVIAGIGETMASMAANSAKQFESVLQVANRNTEFLDSPGMQECVSASDFRLSDLKTDPKGVSVFLSLPQRYMGEHFRWLRMMITLTINEMEAVPGQPASGHRVLVCLDEFAGLKRMEVIENAVAQSAGFGVKLFFVLQSLEQLKATYKDNWETFLSNAGLKLFFGLDDHFSRKYVSEFVGETELIRELATSSESFSEQTSHNTGTSSSQSWNKQKNTGTSFSDNWKAMPFFLKHTAGFFAAISGNRQATRNRNTGTSTSDGGSTTNQESRTAMEGTTRGSGVNESLHKRPLITPDEVGRYFGRIDDKNDDIYPGLGLTILTGSSPCPVQRVNYYEDTYLRSKFSQHPDHESVEPVKFITPDKFEQEKPNRFGWINPGKYGDRTIGMSEVKGKKIYNFLHPDEQISFEARCNPAPPFNRVLFFLVQVPILPLLLLSFAARRGSDRSATVFIPLRSAHNRVFFTNYRLVVVNYLMAGGWSVQALPWHLIRKIEKDTDSAGYERLLFYCDSLPGGGQFIPLYAKSVRRFENELYGYAEEHSIPRSM